MADVLLSIIMPFRNTSLYLSACVESIIQQTEANWELIAVDDFSEDESKNLLIGFAKLDKRIKVYSNKQKGIIGALQLGLSKANGKLITRMDSDDIMLPKKLAIMSRSLLRNGQGHIAIGPVKYFSDEQLGTGYINYQNWLNTLTEKGTNYTAIYKECVIPSPSWMVHYKDLIDCGGFNNHIYPEDYDLAFRFCKAKLKCIPEKETLHLWRDYSNRTSRVDPNYADNTFLALKIKYFLELDYNHEKPILIWGAGKKGKKLAKLLLERNIPFKWICENPNKIGKDIYGIRLENSLPFAEWGNYQSVITVANALEQSKIREQFENNVLEVNEDYFFFC